MEVRDQIQTMRGEYHGQRESDSGFSVGMKFSQFLYEAFKRRKMIRSKYSNYFKISRSKEDTNLIMF